MCIHPALVVFLSIFILLFRSCFVFSGVRGRANVVDVPVQNTGYDNAQMQSRFPFSWLVKETIDKIVAAAVASNHGTSTHTRANCYQGCVIMVIVLTRPISQQHNTASAANVALKKKWTSRIPDTWPSKRDRPKLTHLSFVFLGRARL